MVIRSSLATVTPVKALIYCAFSLLFNVWTKTDSRQI